MHATCPRCGADVIEVDVKCGSCGAPLGTTGAHRMIGQVLLGQYQVVEVLGQGEQFVQDTSARIPEQPRFAFAAGLLALVVVALIALGEVL